MLFDSYPHITSAFIKALSGFGKDADYDEAKALLEITFAHCYEHYGTTEEEKEDIEIVMPKIKFIGFESDNI